MTGAANRDQILRDLAEQEHRTDTWKERVQAADRAAEDRWEELKMPMSLEHRKAHALTCIVAELRAHRIAQRPGGGR